MSSAALHLPYLVVLLDSHQDGALETLQTTTEAILGPGALDDVDSITVEDAIHRMIDGAHSPDRADHVAAAHTYVLANLHDDSQVSDEVRALGAALVAPFVPEPLATEEQLGGVLRELGGASVIESGHVEALATAFGGSLTLSGDLASGSFELGGPAAPLVTMLLDMTMMSGPDHVGCQSSEAVETIDGNDVTVTVLAMETCTNLGMASAKKGVDPRRWPDLNPFFKSVKVLQPTKPPTSGSWAGIIQEVVGPAPNMTMYTTNLTITYVEDERYAATTFDLTPKTPNIADDDNRVLIDRGFVSVTDEGAHRRIRMGKIAHISDLQVHHSWACPLWAWQMALAGWTGT